MNRQELLTRARDVLLTRNRQRVIDYGATPKRFDRDHGRGPWARTLALKGIRTRDYLSDLAVDELVEMGIVDKESRRTDSLNARKHWSAERSKGLGEGGAD